VRTGFSGRRVVSGLGLWACCIFLWAGCGNGDEPGYRPEYSEKSSRSVPQYILGVHPLHNPTRLHEIFSPITDYLTDRIPHATFKVEASRNYAAFDEKLYARQFHFSLPNPYQTVNSLKHGYHVFGKMGDDDNFRGIILVRKDAGIEEVSDLVGRAISFPAPTALAATMMPQYYLQTHGLDVMKDVDLRYVGSQESSVMNVYLGDVAAAATWPPPWRALAKERPELAEALEVKWRTPPLPNNGLVVRDDIPPEITTQVAHLLFSLQEHEQGRAWLARMELSRFEPATDATYDPVREFLREFNETVRPIEH
jgi:phosphonate transport system substrate-binding protein